MFFLHLNGVYCVHQAVSKWPQYNSTLIKFTHFCVAQLIIFEHIDPLMYTDVLEFWCCSVTLDMTGQV